MSTNTLFDRVWHRHTVRQLPDGLTQLFIGLHLIHEVTSPQAFAMLKARGTQSPCFSKRVTALSRRPASCPVVGTGGDTA